MNRIKDKIEELQKYLKILETILPKSFSEYQNNLEKKAACERYFELIVETLIELAFQVVKIERFEISEDYKVFNILFENNIINENLQKRLKNAKGMRNILSHQYGDIDDEIVYEAITEEIINDCEYFIECIDNYYS